jgi:hypothetical protein
MAKKKNTTRTILIIIIVIALLYWLYTLTQKPESKDRKMCCDINYDNYSEDCLDDTTCQCDQSVCENDTPPNTGGPPEPDNPNQGARLSLRSQPLEWGGTKRNGVPMYKYR